MKDQYFGDISHYKETGILRVLSNKGTIKTLVCWMMTEEDGSSDGFSHEYLKDPQKWRKHDPDLYDFLAHSVLNLGVKSVAHLENSGLLVNTDFFSNRIYDDIQHRQKYFEKLDRLLSAKSYDLLFFEIDNGIEVKSVKKGNKNSSKYLYWDEIKKFYDREVSLLIYQHFARENRKKFIRRKCLNLLDHLDCEEVYILKTSRFVMFLLPQGDFVSKIGDFVKRFDQNWGGLVEVQRHCRNKVEVLSEGVQRRLGIGIGQ